MEPPTLEGRAMADLSRQVAELRRQLAEAQADLVEEQGQRSRAINAEAEVLRLREALASAREHIWVDDAEHSEDCEIDTEACWACRRAERLAEIDAALASRDTAPDRDAVTGLAICPDCGETLRQAWHAPGCAWTGQEAWSDAQGRRAAQETR